MWRMNLKNNRAPFLYNLKFLHHFKAIGEFTLMSQSGNAQFGSKSAIFCPVWPWNLTYDIEKRAPLLWYFKLLHYSIAICEFNGVTVRKCPIWVKIGYFLSRVTLKFDRWPRETTGHICVSSNGSELFIATQYIQVSGYITQSQFF